MTTLSDVDAMCALCGARGLQREIASSSTMEAPDLDTRPAEMLRSALPFTIGVCPTCGYVADPSLDLPPESFGPSQAPQVYELVRSARYRLQLESRDFPELADRFLCKAMIELDVGDDAGAGWSYLKAAWACDDKELALQAAACRERAVERWLESRDKGDEFADPVILERILIAETQRRAGLLEDGVWTCEDALEEYEKTDPEERDDLFHFDTLRFILELARAHDTERHTIEEVRR